MSGKDTETIQNILVRLRSEMSLGDKKPSKAIKSEYVKVEKAFIDLIHHLDVLNDLKTAKDQSEDK